MKNGSNSDRDSDEAVLAPSQLVFMSELYRLSSVYQTTAPAITKLGPHERPQAVTPSAGESRKFISVVQLPIDN